MKWRDSDFSREVVPIDRVAPGVGVVGRQVGSISRDGYGIGEPELLPPGRRFAAEDAACKQYAAARPEASDVGSRVAASFVKPDAGNDPGDVGPELQTELDRLGIVIVYRDRRRVRRE